MNEVVMLRGAEPGSIFERAISEKSNAIMSYLSCGKWHVAKVFLVNLGAGILELEVSPRKKIQPMNISVGQNIGMSLKYGYSKFIFGSKVVGLEPSSQRSGGGRIVLVMPKQIEMIQRRSYFRVQIPQSLKVEVAIWYRRNSDDRTPATWERSWKGMLVDLSAGGLQVAFDISDKLNFKKGQFASLAFTPLSQERPLRFNAQVRNIFPTANGKSICIGLQTVGLEASSQGRYILSRLVEIVERYHQMNRSDARHPQTNSI